jgi:hypothetical protein
MSLIILFNFKNENAKSEWKRFLKATRIAYYDLKENSIHAILQSRYCLD